MNVMEFLKLLNKNYNFIENLTFLCHKFVKIVGIIVDLPGEIRQSYGIENV
jgi:hypothetical protein